MRHPVLGVAATIAVLFLIACTNSKGSFSLVNKTKEPIVRASVTICGQTIELKDIQPNTRAVGSYEVKFDSHYTIQVDFSLERHSRKKRDTSRMEWTSSTRSRSPNLTLRSLTLKCPVRLSGRGIGFFARSWS